MWLQPSRKSTTVLRIRLDDIRRKHPQEERRDEANEVRIEFRGGEV